MCLLKYLLSKKFKEEYSMKIVSQLSFTEVETERIFSDINIEISEKVS